VEVTVDREYVTALRDLTADLVAQFAPRVHSFAWKQGKRGGRYWLPVGKPDAPPNRLYGKKAQAAAQAGDDKGGSSDNDAGSPARGEPSAEQVRRIRVAKYEAARDAHAMAASPGSGVPADRVAWLKARMEKAKADLGGDTAGAKPPAAGGPQPGGILTPDDKKEVERRRGLLGRLFDKARAGYGKLEDRYGRVGAAATAAGMALAAPIPVPGTVLAPLAVAEGVRRVGQALGLAGKDPPTPGKTVEMDPAEVEVDPARFQFKLKTDSATGVGRELKDVQTYNPDLAGVIAVWFDPEQKKTYVVNGHHRLELAKRSGAKNILVRYLDAKTAAEARAKGALINIAEGRGTAVDAAKFLRDTGTTVEGLKAAGVSLSGAVARDAVPLSNLDGGLFLRVTQGTIDVPRAVAVASHLPDHDDQRLLVRHLDAEEKRTGKTLPPAAVAEAAKEMAATPKATVAGPSGGLFGNDPEEESIFLQRAELKSHIRQQLAQQAKDFGLLASKRRAANVASAGNVIDTAANKRESQAARSLVDDFDRSVNRSGAVSDAVNRLAALYANAHTAAEKERVKKHAVETVRRLVGEGMFHTLSEWVRECRPFWQRIHCFVWSDWKQADGGKWRSPGGRVLSDATYQRLKNAEKKKAAGAKTVKPAAEPKAKESAVKAGQLVKLKLPHATEPKGYMNAAGVVRQILPDGRVEVRLQQGGYVTVDPSAVNLPAGATPKSPPTPAAPKTLPAATPKPDPAAVAAKALQSRLDLQKSDPANAVITPEEADHTLEELRIRHTDDEIKAVAKAVTGRAGRTAKQALDYLRADLLALHRAVDSQSV
jgi:Arc/MetJ-type ribon-helix-helix transcriptional regulator